MEYTRSELRILWYIKKNGPLINTSYNVKDSMLVKMAEVMDIRKQTIAAILKKLEQACIVVRTYKKTVDAGFATNVGYNPLIKLELVDPDMYLPPLPPPLPLAAVVAKENEELYERTQYEPTPESMLEALVNRVVLLTAQIEKLQNIVDEQAKELLKRKEHRPVREHITNRIRDILPPEEWDKLTHDK